MPMSDPGDEPADFERHHDPDHETHGAGETTPPAPEDDAVGEDPFDLDGDLDGDDEVEAAPPEGAVAEPGGESDDPFPAIVRGAGARPGQGGGKTARPGPVKPKGAGKREKPRPIGTAPL